MPIRLIIELVMACAIITGSVFYYRHVEDLGEAKIVALDRKLSEEVKTHNADLDKLAQAQSNSISVIYEKAVAVPNVGDLGVMCVTPGRGRVPTGTTDRPQTAGRTPVVGGATAFDPSGEILTVGRNDDALIAALQAQVADLVARMNGTTK